MPPATRREAPSTTADDEPAPTGRNGTDDTATSAHKTAGKAAAKTERAADEAGDDTAAAGTGAASSLRQIIMMPSTVARQVADDVVTTVQRPDAVLYLGGLVGLAVVGVLEWPVVAAAGVGVAVASGCAERGADVRQHGPDLDDSGPTSAWQSWCWPPPVAGGVGR